MNLSIPYKVDHTPRSTPHDRRPGIAMQPTTLTIHSTGNPRSSARGERGWLENPNNSRTASWHICVDDTEAVEAIPLDEVAWHAGDGHGPGNMASIAIEICESGDRQKTIQNAAELTAAILKKFGWGMDAIRQHYDWSGKNCPRILREGNKWQEFLGMVQSELKGESDVPNWKENIMNDALNEGLISSENHRPDDTASKWFVLAVCLNLLRKVRR